MNAAESSTIIGKSVKIRGDLSGSENLVMDGELQGTIHLPGGVLTLGPSSRVRADIVAKDVIVYGRLEGDIRAAGQVSLRATAMVQGNIFAGGLAIEENAAFRGKVDPSRAQEPLPSAPIAMTEPSAAARPESAAILRPFASTTQQYGGRDLSHLPAALAVAAAAAAVRSGEQERLENEGDPASESGAAYEETKA
jgi:cytoskeletal protein CcmA (bactofilin family)